MAAGAKVLAKKGRLHGPFWDASTCPKGHVEEAGNDLKRAGIAGTFGYR